MTLTDQPTVSTDRVLSAPFIRHLLPRLPHDAADALADPGLYPEHRAIVAFLALAAPVEEAHGGGLTLDELAALVWMDPRPLVLLLEQLATLGYVESGGEPARYRLARRKAA